MGVRPVSALCEKNNPCGYQLYCFRLFFSHALISNENPHKSTDPFISLFEKQALNNKTVAGNPFDSGLSKHTVCRDHLAGCPGMSNFCKVKKGEDFNRRNNTHVF